MFDGNIIYRLTMTSLQIYDEALGEQFDHSRIVEHFFDLVEYTNLLHSNDAGLWRRVRVIPFETTFVPESDAPRTLHEQREVKNFTLEI